MSVNWSTCLLQFSHDVLYRQWRKQLKYSNLTFTSILWRERETRPNTYPIKYQGLTEGTSLHASKLQYIIYIYTFLHIYTHHSHPFGSIPLCWTWLMFLREQMVASLHLMPFYLVSAGTTHGTFMCNRAQSNNQHSKHIIDPKDMTEWATVMTSCLPAMILSLCFTPSIKMFHLTSERLHQFIWLLRCGTIKVVMWGVGSESLRCELVWNHQGRELKTVT